MGDSLGQSPNGRELLSLYELGLQLFSQGDVLDNLYQPDHITPRILQGMGRQVQVFFQRGFPYLNGLRLPSPHRLNLGAVVGRFILIV